MKCLRNGDRGQSGARIEGISPDEVNALWDDDRGQTPARREGPNPDAGDALWDDDRGQTHAIIEGISPDAGDALWDDISPYFSCRVFDKATSLYGEQNALD